MKNFAYTARDSGGALRRGALSVADRAAALEALRRQGLTPVSVDEAGAAGRRALPPRARAYAAAALVALAAVGAWLALSRRGGRDGARPSSGGETPPPPSAAPARPTVSDQSDLSDPSDQSDQSDPSDPSDSSDSSDPAMPPPSPRPPAAPRAGIERVKVGKREVSVFVVNPQARVDETNAPPRRPLFERDTENLLGLYAEPGVAMPPPPSDLPADIEEQARAALEKDIPVYEDDTAEDLKKKEAVALMKEQLRAHIAAGGTAKDFFTGIIKRQEDEAALMGEARALVSELAEANRVREAREALTELNAALAEQGLPPVRVSPKYRKLLETERKE